MMMLELSNDSVAYLQRHLTARADIDGDGSMAAELLTRINCAVSLNQEEFDYLMRQLEACADKEGEEGQAVQVLAAVS